MTSPDLDRTAFAAWLHAQPPDAVVGYARCGVTGSPVRRWLSETGHVVEHPVTPDWAWELAFALELTPGQASRNGSDARPITAARALTILAEVPE